MNAFNRCKNAEAVKLYSILCAVMGDFCEALRMFSRCGPGFLPLASRTATPATQNTYGRQLISPLE